MLAPSLQTALAGMVDPRERRGIRHGLTVVLTTTVCAVVAGARSFVAVAEWVADPPTDLAVVLGVDQRCPSESAILRLIGKVDADRFDTVIGAFVQTLTAAVTPAGRRRVLAVDGKSLRGSRHTAADGTTRPGRHLLAAIDHHTRTVPADVADGSGPTLSHDWTAVPPLTRIPCGCARPTPPHHPESTPPTRDTPTTSPEWSKPPARPAGSPGRRRWPT